MHTTATNIAPDKLETIQLALSNCLSETNFTFGKKYQGKVRDTYDLGDGRLVIVTTDRLSAFDRNIAVVPYKGQVLNLTSVWWFEQTESIVPNHLISVPDPNVVIVKKCEVFPIEFVVRRFMTGSTSTSLWTQYKNGVREYCGVQLREGMQKNQLLDNIMLTPTTKEKHHDRPISPKEIVSEGWMTQAEWDEASQMALALFRYGIETALKHDLLLVDTKYEFGRDSDGKIVLVDEIHTPDSSRYWIRDTYIERYQQGLEPENIDKEFLRLWFAENCDPYQDKELPEAPQDLIVTLSSRYIQLYEAITGRKFYCGSQAMQERILRNLAGYLR